LGRAADEVPAQELVERARRYAIAMHRRIDHRRRYTNQPYEVHLKAVAQLVAGVTVRIPTMSITRSGACRSVTPVDADHRSERSDAGPGL
jgi:hypothetical protein